MEIKQLMDGNNGFTFKQNESDLWAIFNPEDIQITDFLYENIKPYEYGYAVGTIACEKIENKCFISEKEQPKENDAFIYQRKDSFSKTVMAFIDVNGKILNNSYFHSIEQRTKDGYSIYETEYIEAPYRRNGFLHPDGTLIADKFSNVDYYLIKTAPGYERNLIYKDVIIASSLVYTPRDEYGEYVSYHGLIDKNGNWVLDGKYHRLTEFKNGIAKFYNRRKDTAYIWDWGYIDTRGEEYIAKLKDGKIQMCNLNNEIGPIAKPGDILKMEEETRFLFENGLYGYIKADGTVIAHGMYESAVYCFWEGLGFAKKNGYWGFINTKNEPITDFKFEAAGFIAPGYAQGILNNEMYLIGIHGEIAKKKNGYFGYRRKLTDNDGNTRYSCGTFPQPKFESFFRYDDFEQIFIDEFDYKIQDKRPSYKQYPAEWEWPHRANFLMYHEASNTYYFKMGNKFGMDITGKQVLLADLKYSFEEVDINSYLSVFSVYYPDFKMPPLWKDLVKQGWVWQTPTEGYADCAFSRAIQVRKVQKTDRDLLMNLTTVKTKQKLLNKKFCFLAQADGTGGLYYYFCIHEDTPLEKQPIVFLGSEGEINVVASNLEDFLLLLTVDAEIIGDSNYTQDSLAFFVSDEDTQTTYLADYKNWLTAHDLNAKITSKERKLLIKKASDAYSADLFTYLSGFDKKRFQ